MYSLHDCYFCGLSYSGSLRPLFVPAVVNDSTVLFSVGAAPAHWFLLQFGKGSGPLFGLLFSLYGRSFSCRCHGGKTGCEASPVLLIRTSREESKMTSPAAARTLDLRVWLWPGTWTAYIKISWILNIHNKLSQRETQSCGLVWAFSSASSVLYFWRAP